MNPTNVRFSQPVNGRPPQILTNSALVHQQSATATTPSGMVLVRQQPALHTTTNPNTAAAHGTPVRGLVVSQPNRPLGTNTPGAMGTNIPMLVSSQPVSILPRGGLLPASATVTSTITPTASTTVLSAHSNTAASIDDGMMTPGPSNPRVIPSAIRPRLETSISTIGNVASTSTVITPNSNVRLPMNTGDSPRQINAQVNKCHSFLSCLIRFSQDSTEKRRRLISIMQELIDAKITVVDFMERVTDCLNSNSQLPQLRPFLEKVLPKLRREMYNGNIVFNEGNLRPPPLEALQPRPPTPQTPHQQVTPIAVHPRQIPHQHQQQHQHPQVIHAAAPGALTAQPVRQPYGSNVTIHSAPAGHQMTITSQRPTTSTVTATHNGVPIIRSGLSQRAIAVSSIQGPGLRALHPRPPPIMTVNAGQQQQSQTQLHQQQHQHPHQHQQQHQQQNSVIASATSGANNSMNATSHGTSPASASTGPGGTLKRITPRTQASTGEDYEEYNDVAMMGGVNITEESRNILPTVAGPTTASSRTCKEHLFLPVSSLRNRILKMSRGIPNVSDDALALISHALEERLKNIMTHLSVAVEHRTTQYRECPLFEQETDVRGQTKFLEEIDRAEKVRHDDEERAALIKAARSRSRNENTDHIKMKEKARLMMQKEYEMEKQREANITALAAIGPRKKRKLDTDFAQLSNDASSLRTPGGSGYGPGMGSGVNKADGTPAKRIIRRATMKDMMYVMERDPIMKRSQLMWKAVLK